MSKKYIKQLAIINSALVASIAFIAFIISYAALREIAFQFGVGEWLSFLWPLLIDLSLVVFTLSYIVAHITNNDTRLPKVMIGVYTVATIFFNLIHAHPTLFSEQLIIVVVAIVAPISLFLTTETLAQQFKDYMGGTVQFSANLTPETDVLSAVEPVEITKPTPRPTETPRSPVEQSKDERLANLDKANQAKTEKRDDLTVQILTLDSQEKSKKEIAEELGVSRTTVYNHLKKAEGLQLTLNGNGHH